jgi:hypothetical protein
LHLNLSMQRYQSNIMIIINHDYKVVNLIHKVLIQHNKVELLWNDCNNQESLMSETTFEPFQPCKGNSLTT